MRLVEAATGFDYRGYLIGHALSAAAPPAGSFDIRPTGTDILGAAGPSRLTYREDRLDEVRRLPWCVHLALDAPSGTAVPAFVDGRSRFGEAVVVGPSRATVEQRLAELRARLAIETVALSGQPGRGGHG
jgi:hypothetical protein